MKAITNLIKSIKREGWKRTKKKWYYNFVMLQTPEKLMEQEITGYIGSMVGIVFAMIFMWIKGLWYITFAMAFSLLILYAQLKGKLKQKQILKDIKDMKHLEVFKDGN